MAIAMMGVGGYLYKVISPFETLDGESFMVVPIFMLAIGGLTLALSIFGFFGGLCRNNCLTKTYAILMTVLVVCEISGGITGFVKQDLVSEALVKIAKNSMTTWQAPAIRAVWDTIQYDLDCCGVISYQEWSNGTDTGNQTFVAWAQEEGWNPQNNTGMNTEYPVPDSCCVTSFANCGLEYDFNNVVNLLRPVGENKGCSKSLGDWISDNIGIVAGVAVAFAVIELLGIAFACYLLYGDNGYISFENENYY